MCRKKWLIAGGVGLGLTLANPVQATDKHWAGDDLASFSDRFNWLEEEKPGSSDRAINEETERIKYDQVSGDQDYSYTALPYVIDKFWGDGESGLVFERANDPENGTPRALQVLHGLADAPPDVNDHEIRIGRREALWIGDGFIPVEGSAPSTAADIDGYSVTADGGADWAMMCVTQTLGAGAYDLKKTHLGVGYALEQVSSKTNWEFRLDPFDSLEPLEFDAGIDSDRSVHGAEASPWTITGSRIYAKRAEDLGEWTVVPFSAASTLIGVREYMEVYTLDLIDYLNTQDPGLCVDAPAEIDPHGLRVLRRLAMDAPPPHDDRDVAPWAKLGQIRVQRPNGFNPQASVSMQRAAEVLVHAHRHEDSDAPEAVFDDASILYYGCESPWKNDPPRDIFSRYGRNHFFMWIDDGPVATLEFKDGSIITLGDYEDCGIVGNEAVETGLLVTLSRANLSIETTVSEAPGNDWYTGQTDLVFQGTDDLTFEAIAEDGCRVWFVDVPGRRCLKHWQHMKVDMEYDEQDPREVQLVDEYDNHECGTAGSPKDGALYVTGMLRVPVGKLVAGDIQVYYGEDLNSGDLQRITGTYPPVQLVSTIYGDFDGDCCVEYEDYLAIAGYVSSLGDHCTWANADYDGDCVVGVADAAEVLERYNYGLCWEEDCDWDEIECPFLGGGDGPQQGGQESEEVQYVGGQSADDVAAFADAVLGYLTRQDPQDSGEEDTVQHMIDSFDRLTAMYFDADQKDALADSLEKADYASDAVAQLTAALVTKLRG